MTDVLKLAFAPLAAPAKDVLVVFCDAELKFGPATRKMLGAAASLVTRAAAAERFTGKNATALNIVVPGGIDAARLIVIGTGKEEGKPRDFVKLGGAVMGRIPPAANDVRVVAELVGGPVGAEEAADMALGMRMRAYLFDRYKTKRKEGEEKPARPKVTIAVADPKAVRKPWERREAVADGVDLARDLVNEPPNIVYPEELARRAGTLKRLGVAVEILDERAMRKLKMSALLAVGQGSAHESRLVVMRWNGGKRGEAPLAFLGKGVCFDTGGISIKDAAGMEDMKGDMAGGACVVGLMHVLAARKARVNAVGIVGAVENMPDGKAQRPGDIVTSMSGQTIEVINTDAEGRLVLADALWYTAKRFKPRFMIDLATLTGAIIVALGHEHAGLYANDEELAERLVKAGAATAEKVWRMPLAPEYDKLIDSRFADVKNTAGRWGGSITAAQFLQRFVDKTPWAHLDVAGTAFGSPQTEINRSWGSGYGVRLLDRLVADNYER